MQNKIKIFSIIFLSLILFSVKGMVNRCYADNVKNTTLQAGISLIEQVPSGLMGTWRVVARLDDSSNYELFKDNSVDIWNLSRENNVIKLENPFSGANATVNINYVSGNVVRFTKTGNYDKKVLTDTVQLKLTENSFVGINTLKLDTLSNTDGAIIKTDTARYFLRGEKISGMSVLGK